MSRKSICQIAAGLTVALLMGTNHTLAAEKLGASLPLTQGPFFTAQIYGMTEEAKKLGYDLVVLDAGGYGKVDKQVSDVENLMAQKVKAILLNPADPTSFTGVLSEAKSNHVPVVGAGMPFAGTDGSVSPSHCEIGKALAEGAKTLLPNGGQLAALVGPAGGFWATERWRCFKEQIANTKIQIVAEQASEPDAAVGLSIATDILQRFPTVQVLYGADDTVGVGAARAVQANGSCGKVKVLTAVLGDTTEELMKAGCVDYVVALQVVQIGRQSVQMADKLIKGGKLEVKDLVIPVVPVTPKNLSSVDLSTIRQPAH
jgi:ABC-type sugar transport system substrate-binding protein